ncbi:hypothetical protein [Clostridium culturomicium]|uniref:hypothetical protein n=1 Tax=Clostridium culturomicium TaxID=1499683 RepID=UPI0005911E95|nr:hypothetical protein [Clostridium culturomicium]
MAENKIDNLYKKIFRISSLNMTDEEKSVELLQYYSWKGKDFSNIEELLLYINDEELFIYSNLYA